jgi:putative transcriptional regulator
MIEHNYKGYLLASHPKRRDGTLRRSSMLILDHDETGAIGLQINKQFTELTFQTVMKNVGFPIVDDRPLYTGGQESVNRIHVIHSLDWYTANTTKINDNIGVSHDVSVLAAISKNEGPDYFRVVAGFTRWLPGHLEGEILGEDPWDITDVWTFSPATIETVFNLDDIEQWHKIIEESSKLQVASWF